MLPCRTHALGRLAHDGQARKSRRAFQSLSKFESEALLAFLDSL